MVPGESELGEHGDDEPGPALGLAACTATASSIQGCSWRSGTCARCRTVAGRPASTGRGPGAWSRPKEPQGLLRPGRRLGEMFHLDVDDGALHHRRRAVAGPAAASDEPGVQAGPGTHRHRAVARVGRHQVLGGLSPGPSLRALHAPAVARWAPTGVLVPSRPRRRIGIEDPIVSDPSEELGPDATEAVRQGDRVVAGVEDEQRHFTIGRNKVDQSAYLVDGGIGHVLLGGDALDVHGAVQLSGVNDSWQIHWNDQPATMAGRPSAWTPSSRTRARAALGVAAVPGGGVDGEDHGPVNRTRSHEQTAEPVLVDPPPGERLVEAAMGPGELGFQAQRGHRSDRSGAAQTGVGQLEQASPQRVRQS